MLLIISWNVAILENKYLSFSKIWCTLELVLLSYQQQELSSLLYLNTARPLYTQLLTPEFTWHGTRENTEIKLEFSRSHRL